MPRSIFSIILLLGFLSCSKSEVDSYETDMGYDYFPVTVGQYRTYMVDSIIYSKTEAPDTISCQIKETIVEKLQNGDDVKYRILREWRPNGNSNWQPNTVWWIRKEPNRIIQTEENLKFVKLTFPIKKNVSWDGNTFFDDRTILKIGNENMEFFKEWEYRVDNIKQEAFAGVTYDHAVTVVEADFETSIELRQSKGYYAKSIGLIARKQRILDTQCITCTEPWTEKAEKGVVVTQILIDHN